MPVNAHKPLSSERQSAAAAGSCTTASAEDVLGAANPYPRALQPLDGCHNFYHKTWSPKRHRLSPSCFRSQPSVYVPLSRRRKTFDSSYRSDLSLAVGGGINGTKIGRIGSVDVLSSSEAGSVRRLDPTLSPHDESMRRVVNGDNDFGFWDGKGTAAMKTQRFSGSPYPQSQSIFDAGRNVILA